MKRSRDHHLRLPGKTLLERFFACLVIMPGAVLLSPPSAAYSSAEGFQRPAAIQWNHTPLRTALVRFADAQEITLFLDRRVDPSRPITFRGEATTADRLLEQLADRLQLDYARFGPIGWFGPSGLADELLLVKEIQQRQLEKLPPSLEKKMKSNKPCSWERFSTPRTILETLGREADLTWKNPETIPHDLWPAVSLPSMPLYQRLILVLFGFKATYVLSSEEGRIAMVPLPRDQTITLPLDTQRTTPDDRWKTLAPESEFVMSGGKLFIRGPFQQVARVDGAIRNALRSNDSPTHSSPSSTNPLKNRRFTIRIEKHPMAPLLKNLAEQMELALRFPESELREAGIDPQMLVSFEVKKATAEELFHAILDQTGCRFQLTEDTVTVFPPSPR